MLAQANRVTSGADYRIAVRRGRRFVGKHLVAYVRTGTGRSSVRFGFIVAKNVGGAVQRNRVRRRLKAASFEVRDRVHPGTDVVFRALPGALDASWATLRTEVAEAVEKGAR